MKIKNIYCLAIRKGIEHDPRGQEVVEKILREENKKYLELSEEQQKEFDRERLTNPYHDTRVLYGDLDLEVKKMLVGIDIEIGEILLADRLREKGQNVDLVLSHHPEGKALANLYKVMHNQEGLLYKYGVSINTAESILAPRINEVKRSLLPLNHNRAVDAAKILDIPFMCVHSAADNHVAVFLQKLMKENNPERLGDIIDLLKTIPEYQNAVQHNAGPLIVVGSEKNRAGKILVSMAGGTSGSELAYEKLALAGVGTVLVMHLPEKHRNIAKKNHLNIIVAGHMASDSLGMNLFLDEVEKQGVEIIPCSGFIRNRRF
ncbi:NGG1p interacting factor NIF3 [Desulfolucanica intricata]|uniref:NGG1p interacting factor NIF3 n=1 Tax=Desulfolucanica intricata TaxID=1285191 RepID=UPI00082BBFFC|nr:NGG1p interacting factor NIF3 [Desulfolucanica intricata]